MKIIFKRIVPAMVLLSLLTLPALAQTRIATVDLRKVFENYWKRQQAEAALKDRGAELDKEYKGFIDDYTKLKEDYNKLLTSANDQSVTPEEREKRKTAAEAKFLDIKTSEKTIQTFEGNAREQLDTQKKRMRDTILQEIRTVINAKAKAAGYGLVIDSASESINNTPVLLYTNGENDMTDSVLAQLNVGAPPPSATSPTETPKADDKKSKSK
jgi:outer membrane protein